MKALVRAFFRITLLPLVWLLYRPRALHANRVPDSGGVLLISNHVTYIDSFLIYATCPRPVRFVVVSNFMKVRIVGWFMQLFGAIPIQPSRARDAIRQCAKALRAGDVVCIFPEGQLTRTGVLAELKKGFELIAAESATPVVPLYVDGSWASIFSFERGKTSEKFPEASPAGSESPSANPFLRKKRPGPGRSTSSSISRPKPSARDTN